MESEIQALETMILFSPSPLAGKWTQIESMYFLLVLKMGIFQPAMLDYRMVPGVKFFVHLHDQCPKMGKHILS